MKKKIIIVLSIWLVLAVLLPCGVMMYIYSCLCHKCDSFVYPNHVQRYYSIFENNQKNYSLGYPIATSDDTTNLQSGRFETCGSLMLKEMSSDSFEDLGYGVKWNIVNIATSQNGDIPISTGAWGIIVKCNDIDYCDKLRNSVALWNIDDLYKNGNGKAVYKFQKECEEDIYYKVDKLFLDNYIAYPVSLSAYTVKDNQFLQSFDCYSEDAFPDLELVTLDNLVIKPSNDNSLSAAAESNKLVKMYANRLRKKLEFKDEPVDIRKAIITPFGATVYFIKTENGYGGISVSHYNANSIFLKYFGVATLTLTIITILVLRSTSKKEKERRN